MDKYLEPFFKWFIPTRFITKCAFYIGETDADSLEPIDYLSYISNPTTRDIVSRSIRGESQSTIAESLGISRQTVSRMYSLGIQEIRESFGIREQTA